MIAIHAAGVQHCDLAPRNVVLHPSGRLVVIDFGMSMPHLCDGHCAEIVDFAQELGVEPHSHSTRWTLSHIYAVCALLLVFVAFALGR